MLAAVWGTKRFFQINSNDNNINSTNSTVVRASVIQKSTDRDRPAAAEMFSVGFFNGSIGSWDPAETLKPTVLHELMEPTRGSQRKQMDFVCDRRREPESNYRVASPSEG